MKKILSAFIIIFILLLSILITVLSIKGLETEKFNGFIADKIIEKNKDISIKLNKINFKFDIKDWWIK